MTKNGYPKQDHSSKNENGHPNQSQDPKLTAQRKWVINLSSTPLTSTQRVLFTHGPNFAVAPNLPYGEYITAIELACQSLNSTEVEELRDDIYRV